MTEKARPYGYYIAKTITFTLGEENKIQDVSGADVIQTQPEAGTENLYSENQLYVRDVKINGSLKLTKTITQGEEEKETLAGVTFALYLVKGSDERTLRGRTDRRSGKRRHTGKNRPDHRRKRNSYRK